LWDAITSKFKNMKLDDLEATVKVLSDNLATYLNAKKGMAEAEKRTAKAA
jgi:hypothetical protein